MQGSTARLPWTIGRIILLLLGGSVAGLHPVVAQSCFRAHPFPRCRSYWVAEAGLGARLNPEPEFSSVLLTIDAGYMVNAGPRSAFGGTMFLQSSGIGVRRRYRRWLNTWLSVDAAPGLVVKAIGGQITRRAPAFSGQLGLNAGSVLAMTGQVDVTRASDPFRFSSQATDVGWYVGGRLNNGAGLAGILACVAAGALVAATWED